MKSSNLLRHINSLEERNGVTEAICLLEQELKAGNFGKLEMLRLIFLYWFAEVDSIGLIPGVRDLRLRLHKTIEITLSKYSSDGDCHWVIGYLLTQVDRVERIRGMILLDRAVTLAPGDPLPRLMQKVVLSKPIEEPPEEVWERLRDWGMMGEYFSYVLMSGRK